MSARIVGIHWLRTRNGLLLRTTLAPEGVEELAEVAAGDRLLDAEGVGLFVRTTIGAENDVHQRGNVGVVTRFACSLVVPVMEFRCTDEPAERADREANV